MADPTDQSLLDRLNALKPTAVKLDTTTNALGASSTNIPPAEPLSREDALSHRLKTLRGRQSDAAKPSTSSDPPPPYSESPEVSASPAKSLSALSPTLARDPAGLPAADDEDADKTLDEILDSLVLEDDHWSVSDDAGTGEDDSKRVEDLLARLKVDADAQPPPPSGLEGSQEEDQDDDSDGEVISRQADDVLSRTIDALKLDKSSQAEGKPPDSVADDGVQGDAPPNTKESEDLALPTVPQDVRPPPTDKEPDADLTLPTVPTHIQSPAANTTSTNDSFESSIAARLAALGHSPVATDDFGLPAAPTFQPADRPIAGVVRKPSGYTDDDQKTWCIVCLENATVRCLGCDGDVFCARCWRDMHVGPSAGYDERGHAWEKFDARRL